MTKKIEVFASEALPGELEDFPDIKRGWGTTKESTGGIPPMKWFNAIQKRTDEAINSIIVDSINGFSFKTGGISRSVNDWFEFDGSFYLYNGDYPFEVIPGSSPDDNKTKWIKVVDNIRGELTSNEGASIINTSSGMSVDYEISVSSKSVSLSRMMSLDKPLEKSLELSRTLGVELIVDCNCQYDYLLIKPNDSIRGVGYPILTKKSNEKPNVGKKIAPERPVGTTDDLSKNAFFVIYHEDGKSSERISITGGITFSAGSEVSLDCYAYIPRISFSKITDLKLWSDYNNSELDGFVFHDEYACTIGDIHILNSHMANRGFVWEEIIDGKSMSTGTSGNLYGLHAVKFRFPFKFNRHQYSEVRVSGGEYVGIKDELNSVTPIVFDIVDSNIVLVSPSSEHLYGGFVRVNRTDSTKPSSCLVLGGQLNTAIFGSKDDKECRMFYADGGSTITIDGGYYVSGAKGYHLVFGGSMNDSSMDVRNLDGNYILNSIKNDTKNYTGFHKFDIRANKYLLKVSKLKQDVSVSGIIPLSDVEYDPFGIHLSDSRAMIKRTGFYSVNGSLRTLNASGYILIKIAGTERSRSYFDISGSQTDNKQTDINFKGRINSGSEVSIEVVLNKGVVRGQDWFDCKMDIELIG